MLHLAELREVDEEHRQASMILQYHEKLIEALPIGQGICANYDHVYRH